MVVTTSISELRCQLWYLAVTVVLVQPVWSVTNITQSTCAAQSAVAKRNLTLPGWGVNYTTERTCALEGSTANLSCSYMYPSNSTLNTTFWFTKCDWPIYIDLLTDSDYTGRVNYSSNQNNTNTLTITDLRQNDSAIYWFRFITNQTGGKWTGYPGVFLSVTGEIERAVMAGVRRAALQGAGPPVPSTSLMVSTPMVPTGTSSSATTVTSLRSVLPFLKENPGMRVLLEMPKQPSDVAAGVVAALLKPNYCSRKQQKTLRGDNGQSLHCVQEKVEERLHARNLTEAESAFILTLNLGHILAYAMESSKVPAIGFVPTPKLTFVHDTKHLPLVHTCSNGR